MRTPARKFSFVYLALALAVITVEPAAHGQNTASKKKNSPANERAIPVVDFVASKNSPLSSQRRARNHRHDLGDRRVDPAPFVMKESEPEELYELTPSHAPVQLALPVFESDAVVIGEVVGAEAYLSNDRTSVYSEFTLQLSDLLKNTSKQDINIGSLLTAERTGGGVRFESGKVLRRGRLHETMPLVGRRYLLFLKRHDEAESFSIITGYELRDGRVYPLDGVNVPEGGSKLPQFAAYDGVQDREFLNEVRVALTNPAAKK